jgi:hypothetical protein
MSKNQREQSRAAMEKQFSKILCEKRRRKKKSNVFATTRGADRVELIPDTKRKLSRLNIYTGPSLLV